MFRRISAKAKALATQIWGRSFLYNRAVDAHLVAELMRYENGVDWAKTRAFLNYVVVNALLIPCRARSQMIFEGWGSLLKK